MKILEENLKKYAADSDKPVFFITHEPPYHTLLQSNFSCFYELRQILNKYPQVISISGHTHAPVFLDRNIWQGEFTAVNAGSLYYWKDTPLGTASQRNNSCDAMIFEIYEDEIIIRRYNMLDGTEIAPDNPWRLQLPLHAANTSFDPEKRQEIFPIPEFAENDCSLTFDKIPFAAATIHFPSITPFEAFHNLRIKLLEEQKGRMTEIAVFDHCSNYREPEQFCAAIPVGMLKENCRYHSQ